VEILFGPPLPRTTLSDASRRRQRPRSGLIRSV